MPARRAIRCKRVRTIDPFEPPRSRTPRAATWFLAPAWILAAGGAWIAEERPLETGLALWAVLVASSLTYVLAPRLGPYLTWVAPSSAPRALHPATGASGDLGTGLVRASSLLALYVVAASFLAPGA